MSRRDRKNFDNLIHFDNARRRCIAGGDDQIQTHDDITTRQRELLIRTINKKIKKPERYKSFFLIEIFLSRDSEKTRSKSLHLFSPSEMYLKLEMIM